MTCLRAARARGTALTVLGAAMLVRPAVAGAASGGAPTPPAGMVRVLGARQLTQGVAVALRPESHLLATGDFISRRTRS